MEGIDSGLQFNFTFADGTTWEQMTAFEIAGMMWSDYLADNMTVNIHVEMTDSLPDNVIGGALPAMLANQNYGDFLDAYQADITSYRDFDTLSGMSLKYENGQEKFEARVDLGAEVYLESSSTLNLTRANAKALDIIDGHSQELDGYILMNDLSGTSLYWHDYLTWTGDENSLDFLSVAVHEVGHILGFVSGVDKSENLHFTTLDDLDNYFAQDDQAINNYVESMIDYANPLDMFRYSVESLAANNAIDMSVGAASFFGKDLQYQFATGKDTTSLGDGFQASHWKQETNEYLVQGIMDPLLRRGATRRVSNRDLIVMDAIGYDISSQGNYIIWQGTYSENNLAQDFYQHLGDFDIMAKNKIAQELYAEGKVASTYWWEADAPDYAAVAGQNRTTDVEQMIEQSEIYEGRRSGSGGSWQEAYYSEFSWQEFVLETTKITSQSELVNYKSNSLSSSVSSFSDQQKAKNDLQQSDLLLKNEQNTGKTVVKFIDNSVNSFAVDGIKEINLQQNLVDNLDDLLVMSIA